MTNDEPVGQTIIIKSVANSTFPDGSKLITARDERGNYYMGFIKAGEDKPEKWIRTFPGGQL